MNLTYESAKSLIDGGQFGELRKLAYPSLTQGLVLEPRLRVLVAPRFGLHRRKQGRPSRCCRH